MLITSIVTLIVGVIGFLALTFARKLDISPVRGALLVAAAIIALIIESVTIVPARSVGVQVTVGKPSGEPLHNGMHVTAPWSSVEKFDGATQVLVSDKDIKDDQGDGIGVRLGNATTAVVDIRLRWWVDPNGDVVGLYKRWKSFENLQEKLVQGELAHALQTAFARYDPLAAINGGKDGPSETTDDLAAKAQTALQRAVGTGIKIDALTITFVHYDDPTQSKLNAYSQSLADTRIAQQQEQTNTAKRRANEALGSSGSPTALYQNCLDMVERLSKDGKALPAAFGCGTPPQVVVPAR